jgi:hypothetical protein
MRKIEARAAVELQHYFPVRIDQIGAVRALKIRD